METLKIGVLGSGQVAKVLASGFLNHGHQIKVGSRDPKKLDEWKAKTPNAQTGTFEEAAEFGDVIVLAVKGTAAESIVKSLGGHLSTKVVVDATNPIAEAPPVNGVIQFFTSLNDSLMERLQKLVPHAKFVKAFNSVGNSLMVNPSLPSGKPSMFICGNDDAAKRTVAEILNQFGWESLDFGKVESARAIEPLCMLWCIPGFLRNEWTHAFKLVKQ
ncbi:MAG: NAD(P)-binding domain-containing protein [Cyclobacteriaceae bacterium]|nr:NAD(P)-binding domain-containing protein [Cyclobacteriaceae bacterium]